VSGRFVGHVDKRSCEKCTGMLRGEISTWKTKKGKRREEKTKLVYENVKCAKGKQPELTQYRIEPGGLVLATPKFLAVLSYI